MIKKNSFFPKTFFLFSLLFLTAAGLFSVASFAANEASTPKLIAVKFHADWCGSCKKMGPVFEDLRNKFDQKPVLFVQMDFTNSTTRHQSQLLGAALGISPIIEENQGTGFILLLDSQQKVQEKFTADQGFKDMSALITKHLE